MEPNYGRFIDNLKSYAHGIKVREPRLRIVSTAIISLRWLTISPHASHLCLRLFSVIHAQGTVYAVDESTIFIKSFVYDGLGPDAYFWVGKSTNPSPQGYIIPYPEDYVGG